MEQQKLRSPRHKNIFNKRRMATVSIDGIQFILKGVSPSWYYELNDQCGNTGSGKRDSVKYMDEMFRACVINPAEVAVDGMSYFDKTGDLYAAERLIKQIERFIRGCLDVDMKEAETQNVETENRQKESEALIEAQGVVANTLMLCEGLESGNGRLTDKDFILAASGAFGIMAKELDRALNLLLEL